MSIYSAVSRYRCLTLCLLTDEHNFKHRTFICKSQPLYCNIATLVRIIRQFYCRDIVSNWMTWASTETYQRLPRRNCWVSNSLHGCSFSSLLGLSKYGARGPSQYTRPWQRRLAYNPSGAIHRSTPLSSTLGSMSAPCLWDSGYGNGKRITSAPLWNLSSWHGEEEEEEDGEEEEEEVIRQPSGLVVVTSFTKDSL